MLTIIMLIKIDDDKTSFNVLVGAVSPNNNNYNDQNDNNNNDNYIDDNDDNDETC